MQERVRARRTIVCRRLLVRKDFVISVKHHELLSADGTKCVNDIQSTWCAPPPPKKKASNMCPWVYSYSLTQSHQPPPLASPPPSCTHL